MVNYICSKIVGARYYVLGDDSARDFEGHGSHTASIAAGNNVKNASFYGLAHGTARGGVPSARIAVYKVCSIVGCREEDILAGFDDAIADGVDIISVSLGGLFFVELEYDTIAIASFHATQKGVLTVHSAGNEDKNLVQGKILLCNNTFNDDIIEDVKRVGARGLIYLSDDYVSDVVPYATSTLNSQQFHLVESYINSTKLAQANILTSEAIRSSNAPTVATFSSRGPNPIFPDILKPDISAPGVEILAAYSAAASPSYYPNLDGRSVGYNILSGTSMSCPHVTGAAAYVKSLHPNWSPSAIKSALMTTAWQMNASDAEFSYGAGHLNPSKAAHPGLVYETFKADYIKMICGLNISSSALKKIFTDNSTCTKVVPIYTKDLNYPTITSQVPKQKLFRISFSRTVTNVGLSNSTYKATIHKTTTQLKVSVKPNILSFKALNERKSFVVTVNGGRIRGMISTSLEWFDGIHVVRSPIVIYT
ncbi:hypothetical protein ACH5RR_035783 [Cinchona calisaya]|uniref:Cucumisin n=1 Tax=Cinchona calisaya TaxID=153742 RepID=A0ABD2Y671_9GENT